MKMLALGLEVTRLMGKVEASRLTQSKDGLTELLERLETLQVSISSSLRELEHVNSTVENSVNNLIMLSSG